MQADLLQQRWGEAERELGVARDELSRATAAGRQDACDRLLVAQRACTGLVHDFFAEGFDLESVKEPRTVLSLDVDGVLETDAAGFTSTGVAGAAALKLLQLGRVAVLLNTARCVDEVRDRVERFHLLGGVATFGAATWDAVFGQARGYLSERGTLQLKLLRSNLRADKDVVLHRQHEHCVRASRIVDGAFAAIPLPAARRLLHDSSLDHLTFSVARRYTDFVDRTVDKGAGITHLREDLALSQLPLAAIGDSTCDVPMLRLAGSVLLPANAVPSYTPGPRQRFVRLRRTGGEGLWSAALRLVPDVQLRRRVLSTAGALTLPAWLPAQLREPLRGEHWSLSRLVAVLSGGVPGAGRVPSLAKGEP